MTYPQGCSECGISGLWVWTPTGMARCLCPRGRALRRADIERVSPPISQRDVLESPRLSEESGMVGAARLGGMKFFPAEPLFKMDVSDELRSMCNDCEEMDWLVRRMLRLFTEWPGIPTLRSVFCAKFLPLDRVKPIGICEAYPDGIPPEIPEKEAPLLALAPGAYTSAVRFLGEARDMGAEVKRIPEVKPVAIPTNPNFQPITEADIKRAVNELHDSRGRKELDGE